ncbi:hypothetical protein K1T71_001687 [Dendrolimus kikuchii]|uniref:Uncharacterized protein n=1 Tax=Dendrolimus kikuchii TaxID=765133 RepID=A0ACC1DED9_9NEOP|nr:hypothetical protein K1T71_001687 [Dendrolimus kikuchii]
MSKASVLHNCQSIPTKKEKLFPYNQYYVGDRDQMKRRNGDGQNYWTGAESLESYTGQFLRDTMHGAGEYRWKYRGADGIFVTYEGHFYGNNMHGYGQMSYPDGRVFTGHFYNNVRWGPGIESQACLREDVGLWNGTQLVRLAWRPSTPSIAIDLMANSNGKMCVESLRIIMAPDIRKIGEVNSAIEILKQYGCDPLSAVEKWSKLYPKHCTDMDSQLCHIEAFERNYYKGNISTLKEVTNLSQMKEELKVQRSDESVTVKEFYFAWNNNPNIVDMMKSCYKHEIQRKRSGLNLVDILSGPRTNFKPAGKHELDCRTLLMASYLGHITNVAQLVNQSQINVNVADIQGNSAVMYAACGDQADIIHFLVEAGANVDEFNDACCTPLTVALLRFACLVHDIPPNAMIQAILPSPVLPATPPPVQKVFEWNISRDILTPIIPGALTRTPSKIVKTNPKSTSVKAVSKQFKKQELVVVKSDIQASHSTESFTEEKRVYYNINSEYNIRVNDLFQPPTVFLPIRYIFEVNDINKDIDSNEVEQKKIQEKNPKKVTSKTLKATMKLSQEAIGQSSEKDEYSSIGSTQKLKMDMLSRIMLTILQLLTDGANPRLVRCPQPAILIATVAGSSDLVRHLVNFGAEVNETYPQIYNYAALDVAISHAFTHESLELIRTLLECGAKTKHRLKYGDTALQDLNVPEIPGPTLLHAVLARKLDNGTEEEVAKLIIRREVLELLLEYGCDPMQQFKGRSAMDVALSMNINIFDIFIKYPQTNLNSIINEDNQTILCKIFTTPFCKTLSLEDRLQMVTNLLLFGADPLIECQNTEEKYKNLFVYAKKTYIDLENSQVKPSTDPKAKKPPPPKKDEKLTTKSSGKLAVDDVGDYKQTLDLATECARLLYIRWLQTMLLKELIKIVHKYNHRQWNVILREHKNKRATGLWLTASRCLEIWDIIKTTKRKMYTDRRTLKLTLCIVQYYFRNPKESVRNSYISAHEKAWVENDVSFLLYERKNMASNMTPDITWTRPYVMPEIVIRANKKFNVCFECMVPFENEKIECCFCKLVAFCTYECMKVNVDRSNCHPCSELVKEKYFPSPDESLETPV